MIARILAKILGTNNARHIRRLEGVVRQINAFEPSISTLTDEALAAKTNEFREQLSQGKKLDDILPEAFAVVREASKRTLGQRHYDVQLIGGMVLHEGNIAEMKTGEGKTLTATLPLYLNALTGKGAHLVTVNDYLARRDAAWMSPIYNALGLTVGIIQHNMSDSDRRAAYNADILYATNNELGFDYLRDNMKFRLSDYVQRDLNFAIVDEVDSILIDEARTPLIISGASDEGSGLYVEVNRIIPRLKRDEDYEVDEKHRQVQLTEAGNDKVEKALNVANLYDVANINLLHHVHQALRAHVLFKRDVDYVVKDGEVMLVDEFTGRILSGRRYSEGLHQAIEAKEGVKVERESQTLAAITLQNFFRLYKKLAGMTGTAVTEAEEFHRIYKLGVISVPTNKPMIRVDHPDLVFLTKGAKNRAIVTDIKERHLKGQPILVGTISIEASEELSEHLAQERIAHDVLNAKQHQREAEIVEHAGESGRVTIATNMAGRGTDIKLTPDALAAGGLYILGTERHESRRIDNQLRGRSGRQGDPGESRFYLSLEDDLIRIWSGDRMKTWMERAGMSEDECIESRWVSKTIEQSQQRLEKQHFEMRKNTLEYDDVLNQQRIVIYRYRREVLEGAEQIADLFADFVADSVHDLVAQFAPKRSVSQEGYDQILERLHVITNIPLDEIQKEIPLKTNAATLTSDLISFLMMKYNLYRSADNLDRLREAEKWLMLETIDQAWKQHMLNLDHLKEGIGLRGWGQKNPLLEYKREAFYMFQEMMQHIRHDIVYAIFHLNVDRFNQVELEQRRERELAGLNLISGQGEDSEQSATVVRSEPRVGRNDPCPCGSGKKYKKCCGQN